MTDLPQSPKEAIFYEDEYVYACLALYPLTKGHTVIVWKERISDIHSLSDTEYGHLMHVVDRVRDALLRTLEVEKIYMMYMDEIKHVHWHLVPRYDEEGVNVLLHSPKQASDFSLANVVRGNIVDVDTRG
ncbi:MAG: hypothetical protein A2494_03335 [Candidatus Lloydbacteria bacterium RIFOXYC12_FULL_46_25]|uniref:HIT domain-containing protein n=1 Tax=Candidatus Lloydbacteria bacterium RIFOXYC12_FULL_46_25 TaxID=1798670 RepID=A0A1G2DVV8_9BACT|nr:MAG: hypothetical protein A2494_03335 [Candidatus Lloydbacteria bacterium RIFOXYC12_FULL_46_25]